MTRFVQRRYLADYVAGIYVLAYYAWLFTRTPGTAASVWVGDVAFYPLGLSVGWVCFRLAALAQLDRRTRAAWALLGTQAVLLWLVGVTWPRLVSQFGFSAWPGWIGPVEILQHLLLIAGLLAFPVRRQAPGDRFRFRIDVGLVLVAGFVVAFELGLRAALSAPRVGPNSIALEQTLLDWVVFVAAAVGVLHKRGAVSRNVMAIQLAGAVLYLYANSVLSGQAHYRVGDAVDGIWFAAWVCRWTAARYAWHRYAVEREARPVRADQATAGHAADDHAGPAAADRSGLAFRNALFSYLMLAGAFILLMARIVVGDRQYLWLLATSAIVMAALLLLRQVVELRENRRLFESQLAQEARFRSLVQNSSDVVLVLGPEARLAYVSPAADRVFGAGVLRTGLSLADVIHPSDRDAFDALASGRPTAGRLQARMAKGSGWLDVELVSSDLRDDPFVRGVVLNCRDLTERNELERTLHHAQKLDAVGHLAGGLAHDFNNVLTAIRGYAELLRGDLQKAPGAVESLTHIEQAVDRASAVTRKLLAFSRKQPVQATVLDLNSVLADLQPLLRQLVTDRIEVCVETEPGLWRVKADQGQIEQVVINLATNARDAMPEGGRLRMRTRNRSLAGGGSAASLPLPAGSYVELVVSDEGSGIAADILPRIFEPFFSTKPKERGMGLGLAMVHGIVAHSGGHVSVDSRPGHGATFTILLPRTHEADAAAVVRPAVERDRRPPRTILVVDDEPAVRRVSRRLLERAGHTVIEAAGGQEALELAQPGGPSIDLLVTDLVMPGLHGRELAARFRRLRPGVPIVCMTGFAGDAGDNPSGDVVTATLMKPFSADTLLATVSSACGDLPAGHA